MNKTYFQDLPKPIIGLAPMDGYSDSAFRQTCKLANPDILTYTEFTSADGLHYNAKRLIKKLSFTPNEQPILAQIFGKNEDTFLTALKVCEDMGFTGVDINMGCPSKKVVRSEHGVALRRNSDLAYKLIETLASNTHLPISVKTRLGWSDASDLQEFGKGAQNAGANMLCIHARTYQEPYGVPANWEPLYELKEALNIPVLGNGGIDSLQDGLNKLNNLDGFLIGQATFGNPWIFQKTPPQTFKEKLPLIGKHAELLIETKGELVGCREIRKHLLKYVKNIEGAKTLRNKITTVESLAQIKTILTDLKNN